MSVINTNITALIGQQNLGKSQNALQTSMERLSSGLRINSAADDAAGQAIANRMTSAVTGLNQAARNANDGISLAQTTEGALGQINDNLQRIRELTVQAENGTNSQKDLNSIQAEIGQRLEEIDRISRETEFNGVTVLAKDDAFSIQVGANDGQKIELNLKEITAEKLNLDTFNVNNVTATGATAIAAGETITVDGVEYTASSAATTAAGDTQIDAAAFAAHADSAQTGTLMTDANGNYYVETAAGDFYEATLTATGPSTATTAAAVTYTVADNAEAVSYVTTDATQGRTDSPLAALDSAMEQVSSLRSELGAMQNRFESAITNLNTTSTNLSAARSRIEDADYATEVSNMTRAQILQQAGTSVLAQANQVPQSVLSLLG